MEPKHFTDFSRYTRLHSIVLERATLVPITRQRAYSNWEVNWLPFASPLSGDLVVLSVSSGKYDISQMKNKTEEMASERKE